MRVPYRHFGRLVSYLGRFPGVGDRDAVRLALKIAESGPSGGRELAKLILNVVDNARRCVYCNNISFSDTCWVCSDEGRDRSVIMVVETVMDLLVMEEAGYRGLYHVVDGFVQGTRRIRDEVKRRSLSLLLERLEGVREVVLGLPYTVRGEHLARFFQDALKGKVAISRLARGIPSGGEVSFMDATTLSFSLKRRERL